MLGPCDGPPPSQLRHAARQQPADGGQRLDGAARARRLGHDAHDPRPARRAVRRAPRPRAVGSRSDDDHVHHARRPARRTFHAAGRSSGYRDLLAAALAHGAEHRREGGGVEGRARARAVAPRRRRLPGAVQRGRHRHDPRRPPGGGGRTDDLLLRPARGAQGPRRAARGVRQRWTAMSACGSPATVRTPPCCGRDTARTPGQLARAHRRRREVRAAARGVGVLRAVAARRVVRHGADRGDGGLHPGGREWSRRIPQRGDRWRRRAARRAGRPRRARRGAADACSETARSPPGCAPPARSGHSSSRWRASPTST